MNWKLDKYYSFKEMPLPEKIWAILIIAIPIVVVIFWVLKVDIREANRNFWFPT